MFDPFGFYLLETALFRAREHPDTTIKFFFILQQWEEKLPPCHHLRDGILDL